MFRGEVTFVNVVCILNLGQKICPISPKFHEDFGSMFPQIPYVFDCCLLFEEHLSTLRLCKLIFPFL